MKTVRKARYLRTNGKLQYKNQRAASLAGLALLICAMGVSAQTAPNVDKSRLEAYLRYAEGFTSHVQIAIDDPTPSPFKGYYRVLVHLTVGADKQDRVYYFSSDPDRLITGNIWQLNRDPFLETLEHLPAGGPSFGPADAKVTIVVFSDFQCPYCRTLAKLLRQNIPQKYPNDVRVVFDDYPIESLHKWARAAAEGARCLAEQNPAAFWAFHDWIFDHQQEVTADNLREKILAIAPQNGVDATKLSTCIDTHSTAQAITDTQKAGRALQITRTPTFFVNGREVTGAVSWDTLDEVIKTELNRPAIVPGPVGSAELKK